MTRFSSRLPPVLGPNPLSRAVARLRASGGTWLDLTESNPTAVGLPYPADVLQPLADPAAARYTPEPFGLWSARASVAAEYGRRGIDISPARIALTASTSEAYAFLFKLLCDPGDDVLAPQPSYPLFELLTRLEGVAARPYRLEYHGAWSIDRHSVEAALTPRTRAILDVSPNNPTGSVLSAADRAWLCQVCARHELALIVDEVFAEYPLARGAIDHRPALTAVVPPDDRRPELTTVVPPVLTFSLGGLSKSAGLPQVKLGWLAAGGPEATVRDAVQRLEVICDTYLSASTPVQLAAPRLIEAGRTIRAAIAARIHANLQQLRAAVSRCPSVSLLEPDAGWSAVVRVPATEPEEHLVLRLFEQGGVLVHPGYFFDFPTEAYLVVSLLPQSSVFADGLDRVLSIVERHAS